MNKTKRPVYGGIFAIVSGLLGTLTILNYSVGLTGIRGFGKGDIPPFVPSIIFGLPEPAIAVALLAVAGGILAVRRKSWAWSFAGAVAAALSFMLLGVPAVALIAMSRDEFK